MRSRTAVLFAGFAAILVVGRLNATTITSTSISDWIASVTPGSAQDLNDYNPTLPDYSATGYSFDGFTVTGPSGSGFYLAKQSVNGAPSLVDSSLPDSSIYITTPAPGLTALLLTLSTYPSGGPVDITLSDGTQYTTTGSTPYFGFSSSQSITWISISSSSSPVALSAFTTGVSNLASDGGSGDSGSTGSGPSETPEPTTTLLLGAGLLGLAAARKRLF